MPASPLLIPSSSVVANLEPAAYALPGSSQSPSPAPPVSLAQLLAQGAPQPGTSAFIGDSAVPYTSAAIGTAAVGGGANICRVFWNGSWIIG